MNRREFLKRSAVSGVAGGAALTGLNKIKPAQAATTKVGTMIDLTKCDGCKDREIPACVEACRTKNKDRFPQPKEEDLKPYWPQKKFEDWSKKQNLTKRLTPYNWTFVQQVEVEHQGKKVTVNVPRRCMHCDNPPCANLCPFNAQEKTPEGPVVIDPNTCFGGAKCRDVCPWGIPMRQAGVGLYLKVAPKFAGGGVMYKCDLCHDLITKGQQPVCVEECPQDAITFGSQEEIRNKAHAKAAAINGYIYGEKENGGTSTLYLSEVPFEKIHQALSKQKQNSENPQAPGFPLMPVEAENYLNTVNGIADGVMLAPVAGILAAGVAVYKGMKEEE